MLVSKRFGSLVGGVVSGLPVISAPISFFIALEQGPEFAYRVGWGLYPGMITYVIFGLVFIHLSRHTHWFVALLMALAAFFVSAWCMVVAGLPSWVWLPISIGVILAGIRLMPPLDPRSKTVPAEKYKKPPYLQMVCGAALMLVITSLATIVGPTYSGILLCFPVIGGVLGVFLLMNQYTNAAINLYKGAFSGMFTGWVFMLSILLMLPWAGIAISYSVATLSALLMSVFFVLRAKAKRQSTD